MARKKIVLVLVEGSSDDTALGVILNRLFDKNKVHIEILHGDITADYSIEPKDIVSAIGNIVKDYANSMHFSQVHFQQVIHIVDMDGAYVPDSCIIENANALKPKYSLTAIQTARPDQLILRNNHKKEKLNRIVMFHSLELYILATLQKLAYIGNISTWINNNMSVGGSYQKKQVLRSTIINTVNDSKRKNRI